jgi:hypothetical protein
MPIPGFGTSSNAWSEGPTSVNMVTPDPLNSTTLDVASDVLFLGQFTPSPDGSPALFGFATVTFIDAGDGAAGVPDTGSTLALLSLSSIALVGASRLGRWGRVYTFKIC